MHSGSVAATPYLLGVARLAGLLCPATLNLSNVRLVVKPSVHAVRQIPAHLMKGRVLSTTQAAIL